MNDIIFERIKDSITHLQTYKFIHLHTKRNTDAHIHRDKYHSGTYAINLLLEMENMTTAAATITTDIDKMYSFGPTRRQRATIHSHFRFSVDDGIMLNYFTYKIHM